jgi:TonB family protein
MKTVPFCLLLAAAAAQAQPVPPPSNAITGPSSGNAPSAPAAIGAPHICTSDYPPEAIAVHAEGTTIVGFTITESGKVADVKVATSSGNADLDNAAVTCASHWLYRPAQKDVKPVAVPWKAQVRWSINAPFADAIYAPIPLEVPHDCASFAPKGVAIPPGAVSTLSFHVTAEGKVTDISLAGSSGNAALDRAAMFCAARWSFKPARKDGEPVEISWRENVAWK